MQYFFVSTDFTMDDFSDSVPWDIDINIILNVLFGKYIFFALVSRDFYPHFTLVNFIQLFSQFTMETMVNNNKPYYHFKLSGFFFICEHLCCFICLGS